MSDTLTLPAETRERAGKGASRAIRREGRVPAVIYGAGEAATTIHIEEKILMRQLHTGHFMNAIVELELDGQGAMALRRRQRRPGHPGHAAHCASVVVLPVPVPPLTRMLARWLTALREWLRDELTRHPQLVLMGDFNITVNDRDVWDPVAFKDTIHCTVEERDHFQALIDLGTHDAFRLDRKSVV